MLPPTRSRRLRIAHVTHGLEMGGLEKLLVEFARHTDRKRFELHFFSLGERGLLADEIEAVGWPVTALGKGSGFRPSLFVQLAWALGSWGADVVHTHDERPLIYSTVAARLARVRNLVHTRHRGQNLAASRRQRWLLDALAKLVDAYVCVSQDSARLAVEQGVPARKVRVVWNGIDRERFGNPQIGRDGPAVLVARLSPEKDVATLLRAVALLRPQAPEFRLEIAGEGPCLPDLRELADQLQLGAAVRFLGQVREVPELLARAGLFVLSSVTEGISLTLLEAMASGLPIVATRVGGNPEVIADGETGLLVPARDPESLAAALVRLWRQADLRRAFATAAVARVAKHFEIRRMVEHYECLYANGWNKAALRPPEQREQSRNGVRASLGAGARSGEPGMPP